MSNEPLSTRKSVATNRSTARVRGVVIRRFVVLFVAVFVASALLTWTAAMFPQQAVRAETCADAINCTQDLTATSALAVDHRTSVGSTPVEPDTTDTWDITAHWQPVAGPCQDVGTAQATVEVTWSSGWSATCTAGCNAAGPILGVTVCQGAKCNSGGNEHSWGYTLLVNLAITHPTGGGTLSSVDYVTTDIDDGDTINTSSCAEVTAVTPNNSPTATDSGPFECAFSCIGVSGASATITYQ